MKVCVVGMGYVGSVAAACLKESGHEVIGVDLDRLKLKSPPYEPGLVSLLRTIPLYHPSEIEGPLGEVILVCVGTPTRSDGSVDLTQVWSSIQWVKSLQSEGVVVVKSTVPPGTGEEISKRLLLDTGLNYVSNPEFLREGRAIYDWFHPDRIIVGAKSPEPVKVLENLYSGIKTPWIVTDITSAETIKYAANAFLATKVSFINEVAAICDKVNASIDEVRKGLSLDPRIGSDFLRPGLGYGGSCFPKDIRALDHLFPSDLLRAVITVNNRQRALPVQSLKSTFGSLYGVTVSILGLSFKPETDDIREAPSIDIIRLLLSEGATVRAFDPRASMVAREVLPRSVTVGSDLLGCISNSQATVIVTEWPEIVGADWPEIYKRMGSPRFLFDGRNCLDPCKMVEIGFCYHGVGRSGRDIYQRSSRFPWESPGRHLSEQGSQSSRL